jgi:hypothetical protein
MAQHNLVCTLSMLNKLTNSRPKTTHVNKKRLVVWQDHALQGTHTHSAFDVTQAIRAWRMLAANNKRLFRVATKVALQTFTLRRQRALRTWWQTVHADKTAHASQEERTTATHTLADALERGGEAQQSVQRRDVVSDSEVTMNAVLNKWTAAARLGTTQVCICGGLRLNQSDKEMRASEIEGVVNVQGSEMDARGMESEALQQMQAHSSDWQVRLQHSGNAEIQLQESSMQARLSERDLFSGLKEVSGRSSRGAAEGLAEVAVETDKEREMAARRKRVMRHIKRLGVSVPVCPGLCMFV